MAEVAIKVDKVSKSFKLPHERQGSIKNAFVNIFRGKRTIEKQEVLKGVSFEINKGEFFGIVGRNGHGKSTLLKLLAGVYSPDEGHIHINGKLTPFIELGVGFNPELTGRENVYLNGSLLGFSRKEMEALYEEIVEFAELERFMDQKLKNYSSGMQVRLAFSIAIRAQSDILLLDEVLAVGDAAFQQKCYDYFEQLKRDQRTVVFVSHDMGAVTRFCSHAIYVENGKITHTGSPREISDVYLEKNIEGSSKKKTSAKEEVSDYKITAKLLEQNPGSAIFEFEYKTEKTDGMYIGISVLKNGFSVAEITTAPDKPLKKRGKVTYDLDTAQFNGGRYEVAVALFKIGNRKLLGIGKEKASFAIKGSDDTKGGAMKLEDKWSYKS